MSNLEDVLQEKYSMLRQEIGTRFASMMEGYGHMVNILGTVEGFFKESKKSVKNFIPSVGAATKEAVLADLNTMESEAVMMASAALTMAGLARLYRDTVVDIAGGDLLDMIAEEERLFTTQAQHDEIKPGIPAQGKEG